MEFKICNINAEKHIYALARLSCDRVKIKDAYDMDQVLKPGKDISHLLDGFKSRNDIRRVWTYPSGIEVVYHKSSLNIVMRYPFFLDILEKKINERKYM